MATQDYQRFLMRLEALAALAGVQLTPAVVDLYKTALERYGFDKVNSALEQFAHKTSPRTGLPTVDQVLEALGTRPPSGDERARHAAALIRSKIAQIGAYNPRRAEEELKGVAWAVVKRYGGWERICEMAESANIDILMAQWRELAKSILASANVPGFDEPPELPPPCNVINLPRMGNVVAIGPTKKDPR